MTRGARPRRRHPLERALALLALVAGAPLLGIYVRSELEDVPLRRLLENAAARVEAVPDDADAVHDLARLHAMAWAWRLADDSAVAAAGAAEPWFGYEPPWVPWTRAREQAQPETERDELRSDAETARRHLDHAIELYRRAVELAPDDQVIRLGLAWSLLERGGEEARSGARDLLRGIVEAAAPRELERGGHLGPLLAVEAIDYLLPLLDPGADGAEIARLQGLRSRLEALPRAITPLAVALREGLRADQLLAGPGPVRFDLDGSGRALPWEWLGPDAAWLVWDPRARGRVTSALQLFGVRTFGLFHRDGYRALAMLDDDRDGVLRGAELDGVALWRDADRDGLSDPGEVASAAALGIVAIGCRATATENGWLHAPASVERADGVRLDSWDVVVGSALRPAR